jgi:hypothetical protein
MIKDREENIQARDKIISVSSDILGNIRNMQQYQFNSLELITKEIKEAMNNTLTPLTKTLNNHQHIILKSLLSRNIFETFQKTNEQHFNTTSDQIKATKQTIDTLANSSSTSNIII